MTALEKQSLFSVEDYLEAEKSAEAKHEYLGGAVYAMAGTTRRHNIISVNIAHALRNQLRGGPCQTYIADVKVRIQSSDYTNFYYPDVMVDCQPGDGSSYFTDSPSVIFEVLSKSTERIDRQEKLLAYRMIPDLRHYVLVAQSQATVIAHHLRNNLWESESMHEKSSILNLEAITASLTLEEIYQDTDLFE